MRNLLRSTKPKMLDILNTLITIKTLIMTKYSDHEC